MTIVICKICDNEYKQITQLHLKSAHDINLEIYNDRFPEADIIPPYDCSNCGETVDDKMSLKAKYCHVCDDIINKRNVLKAVRKYQAKKKKLISNMIHNANLDYGIVVDKSYMFDGETRIDNEHAEWNYIPNLQDNTGTFEEYDLNVNEKTGRIREMEKLEYRMRKMKKWKKN